MKGRWVFLVTTALFAARLFAQTGPQQAWVSTYASGIPDGLALGSALAVDPAGNVYVIGLSLDASKSSDFVTIKYGPDGSQQWVALYDGTGHDEDDANAVVVDAQGNVYVTGESAASNGFSDYATVKYNSDGVQQWVARYNGPGNTEDNANAIAVDAMGNVYVTGASMPSGFAVAPDIATVKYSPSGEQLWVARYNGSGDYFDEGNAIAVDADGNVYVTGVSAGDGTGSDYVTIKYNSQGEQLWVARYDGPKGSEDFSVALAVDGAGNVYVTGVSLGSGTASDFATIKYDKDGVQQWVQRYNGTDNSEDEGRDIAVDSSGNVFVTGTSNGALFSPNRDYVTIKYSNDGEQLWVARYNGPADDWDDVRAIAVDAAGNAYVTGQSVGIDTKPDYATVKYRPDGTEEWVVRFNSPTNKSDGAADLAVDASGNVYVTGTTEIAFTGSQITTIKYTQPSSNVVVAPPAPALDAPPDAAADQDTVVILRWRSVEGALSYELQVSTDSLFATVLYDAAAIADTSRAVDSLADGTTYFWRVRAKNEAGFGEFSSVWRFTTASSSSVVPALATPSLVTPPDGAGDQSTTVTVRWSAVDGATSYELQVSTEAAFATLVFGDAAIADTSQEVSGLAAATIYYWRVRAKNGSESGDWSSVWSFTTAAPMPDAVELVAPEEAAVVAGDSVRLVWTTTDPTTSQYRVEVATDPAFSSVMMDSSLTDTTLVITSLQNETYWWRVRGKNPAGWGPFSQPRSFSYTIITGVHGRNGTPTQYSLSQNYPNPFNPSTTIQYTLGSRSRVRLEVFNTLGQRIATLVQAVQPASEYRIEWRADAPSGIYYYRLEAVSLENPSERFVEMKKMVVMK